MKSVKRVNKMRSNRILSVSTFGNIKLFHTRLKLLKRHRLLFPNFVVLNCTKFDQIRGSVG